MKLNAERAVFVTVWRSACTPSQMRPIAAAAFFVDFDFRSERMCRKELLDLVRVKELVAEAAEDDASGAEAKGAAFFRNSLFISRCEIRHGALMEHGL